MILEDRLTDEAQTELPVEFAEELAEAADDFAKSMAAAEPVVAPASTDSSGTKDSSDVVGEIPLQLQVFVGSAQMTIRELRRLRRGSIVALDRKVGEAADIVINGDIVAQGELVLADDSTERFGVVITSIGTRLGKR